MKRALLLLLAGIGTLSFGQNVTENKLSFSYIQLPTNPLSTDYTTYNVVVERKFEQANEDSLNAFAIRLEQATLAYDAELLAWKEKVKVVEKDYYTKMATWQKAVNGGNAAAPRPKDPIYPVKPVMPDMEDPHLHSDVVDDKVAQSIQLAGFDRGDGGVTVTIGVLPLSNVSIQMKKSGSATTTKYTYTANYKMPVEVKVEDPTSGVVLQTILLNSMRSKTLGSYKSQYEHNLWWIDNKESFWQDLESTARNGAFSECNKYVNNKCGYPVRSRSTEVYTVKKFKEHQYNDLTNAYTAASQGYQQVGQSRDRAGAEGKLNEAIKIWKTILSESNVSDKKARVNDKVTALLYVNLAEAYIWLSDFNTAEMYINQAINSGVGKFKRRAEALRGLLTERKTRWNANN